MVSVFHSTWAWISIYLSGFTGLLLLYYFLANKQKNNITDYLVKLSIISILIQISAGLYLFGVGVNPGSFHLFYGVVILFTLTFLYIYRDDMNKKPELFWGLAILFIMGLAIRAVLTFGRGIG
ncbi:MAG: hypothetical protein VYD26_05270 [Actinomycetota bacterium]|nr:hypothetical protein [Actinomycetota bacterium]